MTAENITNPNWWTPVTIDWNGEPFTVELKPEFYYLDNYDYLDPRARPANATLLYEKVTR